MQKPPHFWGGFFGGAPTGEARRISIITHRQQFVKQKVAQKSKSLESRFCALFHLAIF
jgi:hypothetical protein